MISTTITEEELLQVNKRRTWYQRPAYRGASTLKELTSTIERVFREMRLGENAHFQFLKRGEYVLAGSERLPILVTTQTQQFVVKPYDHNDPALEREVLRQVSGILAPYVYHFGSCSLAEEYLAPETFKSLDTVIRGSILAPIQKREQLESYLQQGTQFRKAIQLAAYAFAQMARIGVNYNHNHFLDEINYSETEDRISITDWGTSVFFFREEHNESENEKAFSEKCRRLKDEGVEKYLQGYRNPISIYFDKEQPLYDDTIDAIRRLPQDPLRLTNILEMLGTCAKAIERYFYEDETLRHHSYKSTDIGFYVFGVFVQEFVQQYRTR